MASAWGRHHDPGLPRLEGMILGEPASPLAKLMARAQIRSIK